MALHVHSLKDLAQRFFDGVKAGSSVHVELTALLDGFNALDRSDFAPDAQAEFVVARSWFNHRTANFRLNEARDHVQLVEKLIALLDKHGPLAQPPSRVFRWLNDADLRVIVERDYIEVSKLSLPSGAWKSAVVMAGSITEAILVDLLTKDPTRYTAAQASAMVPTYTPRGGQPTKVAPKKWRLENLIAIATDIGLIPGDRANTFDQVLRDYRNFVHPSKELRAAHPCAEGEALMAKGALDALCDHFDRTL